jgi:glycine hydroxymethyltransferase
MVSSGLRIGTPALATRGFDADAFAEVADIIATVLAAPAGSADLPSLRGRVVELTTRFPLYPGVVGGLA